MNVRGLVTKCAERYITDVRSLERFNECGRERPMQQKYHLNQNNSFVKQVVPCQSTDEDVLCEWSHHRISSTDSKVCTTCLHN